MRAETYTRQGTGAPASKKDSKQRELDYLQNCFAKTGGGGGGGGGNGRGLRIESGQW
jgi:hypothetical protein